MKTAAFDFVPCLALAALGGTAGAQVQVGWSTLVDGAGVPQFAGPSAVDGTGATFVAGGRGPGQSGPAPQFDALLTKVDAHGAVLWSRTYDEPTGGSQFFDLLGLDAAGNVVAAGSTASQTQEFVARYDTNGNQLWLNTLPGPSGDVLRVNAMAVAPSGDVFLAGASSTASTPSDAFIARLRPNGTTAWVRTIDGAAQADDSATDVVLDATGNVFVVGQVASSIPLTFGLLASKIAFDGTIVWTTEFVPPATANHQSMRAALDAQGRLYAADCVVSNNNRFFELVQFDTNGARVWERLVATPANASVAGVHALADGTVLVGAQFGSPDPAFAEGFVGAWDSAGTSLWSTTYSAPGLYHENVTDFVLDPVGGSILVGWHGTGASSSRVLFLAHVTATGQRDWTQILGSGTAHEAGPELNAAADDSLRISSNWNGGLQDQRIHVRRLEHDVTAFCSGDGSATACPCGNSGAPRTGCASSIGVGAALTASGSASLAFDTLLLRCAQLPTTTVLFFQGTDRVASGSGNVFGDGLRCAGGTVVRLVTLISGGQPVHFPNGAESLSFAGHVTSPGLRTYQCWYRNSASFCTPELFNTSNGLAVLWRP